MVVHVLGESNIITYTFPVLIPLTDKTSSTLYQDVMNFFVGNNILYTQNMVGFTVEEADCVLGTNIHCPHILELLLIKWMSHLITL